jgi:hypothetical protein|tara:strand:- start:262 stop:393 length:132 start_codon:yes stop_codon:yes gene_type:complete
MNTVRIGIITNIETSSDEINQIFKYLNILALYLNICFEKEITI